MEAVSQMTLELLFNTCKQTDEPPDFMIGKMSRRGSSLIRRHVNTHAKCLVTIATHGTVMNDRWR